MEIKIVTHRTKTKRWVSRFNIAKTGSVCRSIEMKWIWGEVRIGARGMPMKYEHGVGEMRR